MQRPDELQQSWRSSQFIEVFAASVPAHAMMAERDSRHLDVVQDNGKDSAVLLESRRLRSLLRKTVSDMMPTESSDVVDFGPFRLYFRHRKLLCGREEIHLGGRAMDVLLALARKKGELVTREQLFEAAWPNVSVHESNLKVTVASLRCALRACSPAHEYITTVVGQGYWLSPLPSPEEFQGGTTPPVAVAGSALPELGTVIGRERQRHPYQMAERLDFIRRLVCERRRSLQNRGRFD